MEARAKVLARRNLPWNSDVTWQVVAIEGAVLAAVGLYMLVDPSNARDVVRQVVAAILLAHSALQVADAFRRPVDPAMRFQLLRAGVGLAVGAIVLLAPIGDYLTSAATRWILGFGLIGYGLLALAALLAVRAEQGLATGALVTGGLTVLIGVLQLTADDVGTARVNLMGGIALVAGALLVVYALSLKRRVAAPGAAAPPAPAS